LSLADNPYNNISHDYNNLKAPVLSSNNYNVLMSPARTEASVSFVREIDDKIAFLKNKLNTKKVIKLDFKRFQNLNIKSILSIIEMCNNDFYTFMNCCKWIHQIILEKMQSDTKKIISDMKNVYSELLQFNCIRLIKYVEIRNIKSNYYL